MLQNNAAPIESLSPILQSIIARLDKIENEYVKAVDSFQQISLFMSGTSAPEHKVRFLIREALDEFKKMVESGINDNNKSLQLYFEQLFGSKIADLEKQIAALQEQLQGSRSNIQ
ncbi:MAG: hypothetical protein RLZ12_608 [Bacillota bacterium]|jgi:hypothetical protein